MGAKASFGYIVYDWCQQMKYKAKQLENPKITPQVKKIVERELEVMTDTHDSLEAKFNQMAEEIERLKLEKIRLEEEYFFMQGQYCHYREKECKHTLQKLEETYNPLLEKLLNLKKEEQEEAIMDKANLITDLLTSEQGMVDYFSGGKETWKGKIEKLQRL